MEIHKDVFASYMMNDGAMATSELHSDRVLCTFPVMMIMKLKRWIIVVQ